MWRGFFLWVLLWTAGVLGLAASARGIPLESTKAALAKIRRFEVSEVVTEMPSDHRTLRIAHDPILGYMPAMTMEFEVRDGRKSLDTLHEGDRIRFRLNAGDEAGWIDHIQLLRAASNNGVALLASNVTVRAKWTRPLRAGERVPETRLTNQLGQGMSLPQFRGQALALTFVFTRCPYPEFCPRMNRTFCQAFGLYLSEESGTLVHNLVTVVIDAEGRIRKLFSGNRWKPEELIDELVAASVLQHHEKIP